MPSILECLVLEPPTSREVHNKAIEAYDAGKILPVILRATRQEVPQSGPLKGDMTVIRITRHESNEVIEGPGTFRNTPGGPHSTTENETIDVTIYIHEADKPATASIVIG
jgi:hypothetical protein